MYEIPVMNYRVALFFFGTRHFEKGMKIRDYKHEIRKIWRNFQEDSSKFHHLNTESLKPEDIHWTYNMNRFGNSKSPRKNKVCLLNDRKCLNVYKYKTGKIPKCLQI